MLGFLLIAAAKTGVASDTSGPVLAQGATNRPGELNVAMTVGQRRFPVTLADTPAAREFVARLPLTLHMTDLNDNEKKVTLPSPLPTNVIRPGTIRNGDILLWGSDTLVVFYKTFDSIYSYTRVGKVDNPSGLADVLGKSDVTVAFSRN